MTVDFFRLSTNLYQSENLILESESKDCIFSYNIFLSIAWFCKRNGCERLSSKLYETSISRDVNSSGERFTKAVKTPNVSRTQKKTRRFRWPYVFIVTFQWSSWTESRKQLIALPLLKNENTRCLLYGPVPAHFAK